VAGRRRAVVARRKRATGYLHGHDRLIGGDMGGETGQRLHCVFFPLFRVLLAFCCGSGCDDT
jgi:hypothetical protein